MLKITNIPAEIGTATMSPNVIKFSYVKRMLKLARRLATETITETNTKSVKYIC